MDVTKYGAGFVLLGGIFIVGLATGQVAAMQVNRTDPVPHSKATLSGPVTWGSPDQPYGKRRSVTAADRAAIQSYRTGHERLSSRRVLPIPPSSKRIGN
jgi:hypothetical protein